MSEGGPRPGRTPAGPVPAEPGPPAARPRRGRLAAALVLVLAAGATTAALARGGHSRVVAGTASPALDLGTVAPAPPAGTPGAPGPTGRPTPTGSPQPPPLPAGYRLYRGQAGYWIALPADWWQTREIGGRPHGDMWSTPFTRPGMRLAFVEVSAQRAGGRSAAAALAAYETTRSHDRGYRFYQRIRLAAGPPLAGATDVADLEFADRHEAQVIHYHTLVRAVRTPAGRIYLIQSHIEHNTVNDAGSTEDDWRAMLPTLSKILATFRPG